MGDYAKCKWCGRKFEKKGWNKFLSHNTMGLAGKEAYCSTKCENEAKAASGDGSNSNQGGGNYESQQQNYSAPVQPQDAWGTTVDTISYRLNQLNTQAQTDAKDKEKKAKIVEDMEFGIMRLRSIGSNTEADFFEKKLEAIKLIKKKWYE
jgi:hypothetical protein